MGVTARALVLFTVAAGLVASRVTLRNWGATKGECRAVLPGDEQVADPATSITRAVTVSAPAANVWPVLMQLWADHAQSAQLHVDDRVTLIRPGSLGSAEALTLRVSRIEPGQSLVLFEDMFHTVWSFHVLPLGVDQCRVLSRSRAPRAHGLARLADELLEPFAFVMTRRMLLGIRNRAERGVLSTPAAPAPTSAA